MYTRKCQTPVCGLKVVITRLDTPFICVAPVWPPLPAWTPSSAEVSLEKPTPQPCKNQYQLQTKSWRNTDLAGFVVYYYINSRERMIHTVSTITTFKRSDGHVMYYYQVINRTIISRITEALGRLFFFLPICSSYKGLAPSRSDQEHLTPPLTLTPVLTPKRT